MWWLKRYLPKSLLGRALTILAAPIILIGVLLAQKPFRVYMSMEPYDNVPLPSDWNQPAEWVQARLMYPLLSDFASAVKPFGMRVMRSPCDIHTVELALRAGQLQALAGELTLAEQRERKRLARVLHDHIQQLLVAAKFKVTALGRGGNDSVKQAVREAEGMIDECIAASRSLTAELSPYILHEAGLNVGLKWLASWMADKQGFSVDLEMEEIRPLPDTTKILLFESVRELLFNAVKHSHTHSARVSLGTVDGSLHLVVSDQGVGFDPNARPLAGEPGKGFGLFSIQERLELIGGQFEIASTPGKGSRFTLSVPVTQPAAVRLASTDGESTLKTGGMPTSL